jgi:hypothetical protein
MAPKQYPLGPPMTLGNMREPGVREARPRAIGRLQMGRIAGSPAGAAAFAE